MIGRRYGVCDWLAPPPHPASEGAQSVHGLGCRGSCAGTDRQQTSFDSLCTCLCARKCRIGTGLSEPSNALSPPPVPCGHFGVLRQNIKMSWCGLSYQEPCAPPPTSSFVNLPLLIRVRPCHYVYIRVWVFTSGESPRILFMKMCYYPQND